MTYNLHSLLESDFVVPKNFFGHEKRIGGLGGTTIAELMEDEEEEDEEDSDAEV